MRKVMVFGTFDGVHDGHQSLFRQARQHGDYLIAVVAPDHIVESLKGHTPHRTADERCEHLRDEDHVDDAVIGDEELGTWEVVRRYHPDVVVVGYDQDDLEKSLESSLDAFNWHLEIVNAEAHKPEEFKSGLLNK